MKLHIHSYRYAQEILEHPNNVIAWKEMESIPLTASGFIHGCDVLESCIGIAWRRVRELRRGFLRIRPMDCSVYDPTKPSGGHK